MARTTKHRIIQKAPEFNGFKPFGVQKPASCEVSINYEEYEAIKLCDYELLTHVEAAAMMNISRPTFTRVYESARRKIAKAFVETAIISFEGGNSVLESPWFSCPACKITFSLSPDKLQICPFCQSADIQKNN